MSHDVFLVSSNDITRQGLAQILDSEGFSVRSSVETVFDLDDGSPNADDLLILDCAYTVDQGDAVADARSQQPESRIVVLSDRFDLRSVMDCINSGAQGYIVKSAKSMRMVAALRLVALGEKVVPTDFVESVGRRGFESATSGDIGQDIEDAKLSPREVDVLCCLMAGYPNKAIARKLDVCEPTVKVHVKAILRKLNVRNRTQAALWANSRGISEIGVPN